MSVWSIIVAIIMLGLLVTIHELGHFWVARLLKIKAYEVSIFVGPKLVDWRRNDVEYSIRAIPFGAYVRFTDFDEKGEVIVSDDPSLLINSPRWKRLLVSLAGPFMNLVLGVLIFALMFSFTEFGTLKVYGVRPGSQLAEVIIDGQTQFDLGDEVVRVNGNRVMTAYDYLYEIDRGVSKTETCVLTMRSHTTGDIYDIELVPEVEQRPMIGITHYPEIDERYNGWEIIEVSEYQNNGNPILKPGDYLTEVDGKSVADEDFLEYLNNLTDGDTMRLTYYRNGVEYEEDCIKTLMTYANDRGPMLYVESVTDIGSFLEALKTSCLMPYTIVNLSIKSIGDVFEGKEEVYNMVSGPIGMTAVVSDVVDDVDESFMDKFTLVVQMAGMISIGLMFTNMLPIPGLDGVQVILIIVEMIMGHPMSKRAENVINVAGFILLICLALFAFTSDIVRIILE